jgi:hypothetical protein
MPEKKNFFGPEFLKKKLKFETEEKKWEDEIQTLMNYASSTVIPLEQEATHPRLKPRNAAFAKALWTRIITIRTVVGIVE